MTTLSGTLHDKAGNPVDGFIHFTPSVSTVEDGIIKTLKKITAPVVDGEFTITLQATDIGNPVDWTYKVHEDVPGGRVYDIQVPSGDYDLSELAPAETVDEVRYVYRDGADGADGADGIDGATGPTGPQGPTGPTGPPDAIDVAGLPIYAYGASYSTLNQAFFTAGQHWTQRLAARINAGTVTSYGVNGRRALDVALTLLNGVPISGITNIVAAGKWPSTSTRPGIVVHDALGNDVMNQAAMNGASIVAAPISGTSYLNYLKQHYRTALAFMSSETRIENNTHTASSGTWTHDSAGTWASGGAFCFSTAVGAYLEYSVTPAQHGPLAGVVWVVMDSDIPTTSFPADTTISVDGVAGSPVTTYRATYTGQNAAQVKGYVNSIPVVLPVDGAAHTIRITHSGTGGHYLVVDCILVPSTDPNPILCMGTELPPVVHAAALDAADLVIHKANLIKVTAAYKEVVAEFPNAVYVPSTMTTNGLWSGDGLHPNDRGNQQRANDAYAGLQKMRARLDNRVESQKSNAEFGVN